MAISSLAEPGSMHLRAHQRKGAPAIWLASMADLPAMIAMGRAFHAESSYHWLPFDGTKLATVADRVIRQGNGYAALAGDASGAEPWGMIVGVLNEYWFCRARFAADLVLYVAPGRRRTWASATALRAFYEGFRSWAKMQGAVEAGLSVSSGIHTEATGKLFERFGLDRIGLIYRARI